MYGYAAKYAPSTVIEARIDALVVWYLVLFLAPLTTKKEQDYVFLFSLYSGNLYCETANDMKAKCKFKNRDILFVLHISLPVHFSLFLIRDVGETGYPFIHMRLLG